MVGIVAVTAAISLALQLRTPETASAPPAPGPGGAVANEAVPPQAEVTLASTSAVDLAAPKGGSVPAVAPTTTGSRSARIERQLSTLATRIDEAEQARRRGDVARALELARAAKAGADDLAGSADVADEVRALLADAAQIERWAEETYAGESLLSSAEATLAQARAEADANGVDGARRRIESLRAELSASQVGSMQVERQRQLLQRADAMLAELALHARQQDALTAADRREWRQAAVAYNAYLDAGGPVEERLATRLFFNASVSAVCGGQCDLVEARRWAERAETHAAHDSRIASSRRWAVTLREFESCDFNLRSTCDRIRLE